jgi:hypothetical protein
MTKTKDAKITIDEKEYAVADLSEAVRAHIANIQFVDAQSYCQIWCLRVVGHAAIWSVVVASIPSLNLTPVMTLAR